MRELFRERDLAWTAGLYEGEGTVYLINGRRWPVVQLGMTDREPLGRLRRIWGGRLNGPYSNPKRPQDKPMWRWSFTGRAAILTFFELLWDDLSPRRQEQASRALSEAIPEFERPSSPDCPVQRRGSSGPEWHRRRGEPPCQRCRDNEAEYRRERRG